MNLGKAQKKYEITLLTETYAFGYILIIEIDEKWIETESKANKCSMWCFV